MDLQWSKRRPFDPLVKPISITSNPFPLISETYIELTVQYDNGTVDILLGRLVYNEQFDRWSLMGTSFNGNSVGIRILKVPGSLITCSDC